MWYHVSYSKIIRTWTATSKGREREAATCWHQPSDSLSLLERFEVWFCVEIASLPKLKNSCSASGARGVVHQYASSRPSARPSILPKKLLHGWVWYNPAEFLKNTGWDSPTYCVIERDQISYFVRDLIGNRYSETMKIVERARWRAQGESLIL